MSEQKCGYVALIGAPNAGKSSLVNKLVGTKVSIVTQKVQTTRAPVYAVLNHGDTQIIFVDTPGIFAPKGLLDEAMVTAAWGGAADADCIALLVDAAKQTGEKLDDETGALLVALKAKPVLKKQTVCLVLNKIDLCDKPELLALIAKMNAQFCFDETFMISATEGDGLDTLITFFNRLMPHHPWLYPKDHLTDLNLRMSAAEITREKLFLAVHQEVPYATTVETEKFKQHSDGSYRIEQVIYVQRDAQKKIILGAGGQKIKSIGSKARADIADMVGAKVHLFLFVKVRKDWMHDPERYREMGLQFPKQGKKA